MTDQELDRMMRRVLIDSMKLKTEQSGEEQSSAFQATPKYRRQMQAMVSNPLRWLHRREHPMWRRALQKVAIISLICLLAFGCVMMVSPAARAAVVRWVVEWYGNTINYFYSGEQNQEPLPLYGISDLPEGYVETARNITPSLVAVTYENQDGGAIYFDYSFMHQGAQTSFTLNDDDVIDVEVNGMAGKFFESHVSGNLNKLTWIDAEQDLQFTIGGCFEYDELLHMAETVSLCGMTN